MNKDKRMYNYLVNTLGISKEMVMECIGVRLEDLLSKHVLNKLNSSAIEKAILSRVTKIVTEGIQTGHTYWSDRTKFDDYVKAVVRQILEKRLNDEYEIETKLIRKDKSVLGKV